jgi:hypothetical protein
LGDFREARLTRRGDFLTDLFLDARFLVTILRAEKNLVSYKMDNEDLTKPFEDVIFDSEESPEQKPKEVKVSPQTHLTKSTKKFNKIIKNYKSIDDNLVNTLTDIQKLEKIHNKFVSNAENKVRFHEYGTYIDDIYYQLSLLKMEYNCQQNIQSQNITKLYKDIFRLYNKIVKKLISIKIENTNIDLYNNPLMDRSHWNEKLVTEKKQYFNKVKPFNEISENHILIEDCIILFNEIESRLNDITNAIQDIMNAILNVEEQNLDGILLSTYLISLKSEKEKVEIEHNVYHKLLLGILNSHIDISNKYLERTNQISKEIINDKEKLKII